MKRFARRTTIATGFFIMLLMIGCSLQMARVQSGSGASKSSYLNPTIDVSPDGRFLVFSGQGEGRSDLYLLDISSRKVSRLTKTPAFEDAPCFSPDGNLIAYSSGKDQNISARHIFTRSLDGKIIHQITSGNDVFDTNPSFSNDGKKITFSRSHEFYTEHQFEPNTPVGWYKNDIYIVDNDGKYLDRLTNSYYSSFLHPKFYGKDNSIIFENYKYGSKPILSHKNSKQVISRLDLRTKKIFPTSLFADSVEINDNPYPSHTDGEIIFTASNDELYLVRSFNSTATPLGISDRSQATRNAVFVANQKVLYYLQKNTEIWRVNTDGTSNSKVAGPEIFTQPLSWK